MKEQFELQKIVIIGIRGIYEIRGRQIDRKEGKAFFAVECQLVSIGRNN